MKSRIGRGLLLVIAAALFPLVAVGDTLELHDGNLLEGKYVGGTQNSVRFETNGEMRTIAISDVLALTFNRGDATHDLETPAVSAEPSPMAGLSVPAGTNLMVRMSEPLDSRMHRAGHRFTARLEGDLTISGTLVAPSGSTVYGRLTQAAQSRRLAGQSGLSLELTEIQIGGALRPIATQEIASQSDKTGRRTLRRTARGAAVGALIDGSDGAATGAKIGAGVSLVTRGESVNIPRGTLLNFRLTAPLRY